MNEEMATLISDYIQIIKNKPSKIVSSEEALADVIPIDWGEEVLNGNQKVTIR